MEKIKRFIKKYQMITAGDKIIAGISGGADSVCLFFVLLELRKEQGIDFVAVHVNHGLRGAQADADEMFVQKLCAGYGVRLEVFRVNLELIARNRKQSLEEAGRMYRREAFEKTRVKYGADKVALAHHQNDNAETLLLNLSRGTGLRGLGAIRPVNGRIIHPLLCITRREAEELLSRRGQDFCTDATNQEVEYTRNRIRHLVLPVLENQVNTQTVRHMNETIAQMWELQDYMEGQAAAAVSDCVCRREDCCLIKKESLDKYPELLKKEVILLCMEQMAGQRKDWGRVHVESVLGLFSKQPGSSISLPYGLAAAREYEGVRIGKADAPGERPGRGLWVPLKIPGETKLPEQNLKVFCEIFQKPEHFSLKDIPQKTYTKWFDYAIIEQNPVIRTRQPGDLLAIDKKGHMQKLKNWFINEKIPVAERAARLLIADGNKILWVVGSRMGSTFQISEKTSQILKITITEDKKDGGDSKGSYIRKGSN